MNQGTILGSQIGKWITLTVLVAVLAALLTAGVVRAQQGMTTLKYAENGTDPVATLTATDPEMDTVSWTLGGGDAVDFEISEEGVLTFAVGTDDTPPDFEDGQGTGTDNTNIYVVVVTATDTGDPALTDTFTVTVEVTNEAEEGKVVWEVDPDGDGDLAAGTVNGGSPIMQFQAGAELTVPTTGVTDGDMSGGTKTILSANVRWQWHRSSSKTSLGTAIEDATAADYTVSNDDVGMYIHAQAFYNVGTGREETATLASDYPVLAEQASNDAPEFDPDEVEREVYEGEKGHDGRRPGNGDGRHHQRA